MAGTHAAKEDVVMKSRPCQDQTIKDGGCEADIAAPLRKLYGERHRGWRVML